MSKKSDEMEKILAKLFKKRKKNEVNGIGTFFLPLEIAFLAFCSTSFFNVALNNSCALSFNTIGGFKFSL